MLSVPLYLSNRTLLRLSSPAISAYSYFIHVNLHIGASILHRYGGLRKLRVGLQQLYNYHLLARNITSLSFSLIATKLPRDSSRFGDMVYYILCIQCSHRAAQFCYIQKYSV